ncbi:MAG: hypothetical protein P8090_10700 [Gammaproteobacteria bacterium]
MLVVDCIGGICKRGRTNSVHRSKNGIAVKWSTMPTPKMELLRVLCAFASFALSTDTSNSHRNRKNP